jgi:hypothetical protein
MTECRMRSLFPHPFFKDRHLGSIAGGSGRGHWRDRARPGVGGVTWTETDDRNDRVGKVCAHVDASSGTW